MIEDIISLLTYMCWLFDSNHNVMCELDAVENALQTIELQHIEKSHDHLNC